MAWGAWRSAAAVSAPAPAVPVWGRRAEGPMIRPAGLKRAK